jgi:hypothetical protein
MALRAIRLVSALSPTAIHNGRQFHSKALKTFRGGLFNAHDLVFSRSDVSTATSPTYDGWSRQYRFSHRRQPLGSCNTTARSFSSTGNEDNTDNQPEKFSVEYSDDEPTLVYEGPFASLTLKLKRVSLTSAVIGLVGLPALSLFYGAGAVPAIGQIAVIATAGITAVGSTALLGYCFSPYVHTLEVLPEKVTSESDGNEDEGDGNTTSNNTDEGVDTQRLARIVTRDILARRVETVFNPATDISPPPSNNSRPFCNFMVKGLPMYVHPELVHDYKLRVQFVGEEPQQEDAETRNKKKVDDDEFL